MAKKRSTPSPIASSDPIRDMLTRTRNLSRSANSPIRHYREAVNASFGLFTFVDRSIDRSSTYGAGPAKHMGLLHRFVLGNLIETFERFLKGLAAICIDQLVPFINDDRYDVFSAKGGELIAHFEAGSIGKALCESDTWLNNKAINERFRKLLQSMNGDLWKEFVFPGKGHQPSDRQESAATLAILWQIRHTLAHNSGVLTGSDAMKLRTLASRMVLKDRILSPTEEDLRHVKRFLTLSAEDTNRRVALRISELLTEIHQGDPSLFDAKDRADQLSRLFDLPITVDGSP